MFFFSNLEPRIVEKWNKNEVDFFIRSQAASQMVGNVLLARVSTFFFFAIGYTFWREKRNSCGFITSTVDGWLVERDWLKSLGQRVRRRQSVGGIGEAKLDQKRRRRFPQRFARNYATFSFTNRQSLGVLVTLLNVFIVVGTYIVWVRKSVILARIRPVLSFLNKICHACLCTRK